MVSPHEVVRWTAHGTAVWRHHRDCSTPIAECENANNAPLIAAAPELLQLAQELLANCRNSGTDTDALIERAQCLINKAKGKNHE